MVDTRDDTSRGPPGSTAAALFGIVWESLADLLGTSVTAALLRRSALRAAVRRPELQHFVVTRVGFEYRHTLPDGWDLATPQSIDALRDLFAELTPLLIESTGPVVITRLTAIPELRRAEIRFVQEPSK